MLALGRLAVRLLWAIDCLLSYDDSFVWWLLECPLAANVNWYSFLLTCFMANWSFWFSQKGPLWKFCRVQKFQTVSQHSKRYLDREIRYKNHSFFVTIFFCTGQWKKLSSSFAYSKDTRSQPFAAVLDVYLTNFLYHFYVLYWVVRGFADPFIWQLTYVQRG